MPSFINGKEKAKNYHVSVAGVIGSGKSTACKLLAEKLGYHLFEENFRENKFLPLFYEEPTRWALHSQLFYLREKAYQLQKVRDHLQYSGVVQDGPLNQDAYTYAKAQHSLGHMNDEEYGLYEQFLVSFKRELPHPDLIVQLDAAPETLLQRIKTRGRGYEQDINRNYVETLVRLQNQWIEERPQLKIVRINTEALDLANNSDHKAKFVAEIRSRLN